MPVIEGADLSSITTDFPTLPEGDYTFTVTGSRLEKGGSALIIERRLEATEVEEAQKFVGSENFNEWINLKNDDGSWNEMGLGTLKRYLEAGYGKGSPEANSNDSDLLTGLTFNIYVTAKPGKNNPDKIYNNSKRIAKA